MSSRWYPVYQRGCPQLRVFLPNFWLKLIKSTHEQPANVVQFACSMQMTKYDVKNYLEKIYNIPVVEVRMFISIGPTRRDKVKGYVTKDEDTKMAFITLVGFNFFLLFTNNQSNTFYFSFFSQKMKNLSFPICSPSMQQKNEQKT